MEQDSPDQLTELIHRKLLQLPERKAPETLIRDVLARIEQRQRCWWKKPWAAWPFVAKFWSIPLMMLCAASLILGLSLALRSQALTWTTGKLVEMAQPLAPAWDFGLALANAFLVSLRALEQHWILLSAAVAFLMYLTCLAVGTVCFQVATRVAGRK